MKTMKLWRIAFMMLTAFSLASCGSNDDNEDKVEQVTVYVSAETGVYYDMWLDPERENPIVCICNCFISATCVLNGRKVVTKIL